MRLLPPMLMKSRLFLFFLLLSGAAVWLPARLSAQTPENFPAFSMVLSNGQFFTSTQIPKTKPVLLIYFAPDCDHCQTLMKAFFSRADEFKNTEVLMVTFKPASEVAQFVKVYKTYQYPNILVGTESKPFFLRQFYKLQNTPFTALYNKNGRLISSYRKETPINDVLKQLKKI